MKTLCIIPAHNTLGKKDVTGAFRPEAERFCDAHEGSAIVTFDNRIWPLARRNEVLSALYGVSAQPPDAVAFFCHGWSTGIQAGFSRLHLAELAEAIWLLDVDHVVLYCCSTGDGPHDSKYAAAGTGDDSFADKLRDALCAQGAVDCRVAAHTTAGHTTRNPNVIFFDGMGSSVGGVGGYMPVGRKSPLWAKWRKALRTTDLRFRFPFMSVAEIHSELQA